VNRPLAMRKDGIQTRKRKPKKQQISSSGGASGEKAQDDLASTGMTSTDLSYPLCTRGAESFLYGLM
jgi:GATA-binding protein 4